ncbi:MAG: ATP-binding protein [Bacillota bacterium]
MKIPLLYRINYWWTSGAVNEAFLPLTVRSEAQAVLEHLHKRRVLVVTGPRRTGKSTVLLQTIDHLLKTGVDSNRILFFSGDELALFAGGETIFSLVESYFSDVLREAPGAITKKVYIFIDEAHFGANWQTYIKNYYDARFNIKFVVSGSSSAHLFDGAVESLLGRMEYLRILPLDFAQYVRFAATGASTTVELPVVKRVNLFADIDSVRNAFTENYAASVAYAQEYLNLLRQYFLYGGYPESFEYYSVQQWHKTLREDIIFQGLYRDVVSIYGVKNPLALENLLVYIAGNQGQSFSLSSIGQTVGLDFATVNNYLKYLENAFLAATLDNYSVNVAKTIRKNKKIFVLDNGISNALLSVSELSPETEGALAENCAVQVVRSLAEQEMYKCSYWRDKNCEVDIVLRQGTKLIPIEVKYRNTISDDDFSGIQAFCAKFNCDKTVAITKNHFDVSGELLKVPLWLFALSQ